jgi:uncharacterized protein with von Willebrand factor type A (vWA) domain
MLFVQSLAVVGVGDRESVRDAARAVFVRRREEIPPFEVAFERFWGQAGPVAMLDPRAKRGLIEDKRSEPLWALEVVGAEDLREPLEEEPNRTGVYSTLERLRRRDFGALEEHEAQAVEAAAAALARRLPLKRSRRLASMASGRQLDLRSTLRDSVRTAGDPLRLARRGRETGPRRLVVLCDVSGSMQRYTRILLQFAYAAAHERRQVEAFVFATRLTRVTAQLRSMQGTQSSQPPLAARSPQSPQSPKSPQSPPAAQAALAAAVGTAQDWGGGTRLGECLRTLHERWGSQVLGRGAVVLLISDGCDRGDIELLGRELSRLRRRCRRLFWLNPWLGQEGYQPLVRGMQAALPHVDKLLPIHNLQSLEQLVDLLGKELQTG